MVRDPDGQISVETKGALLLIGIDRPESVMVSRQKCSMNWRLPTRHWKGALSLHCGVLFAEGDHFTAGLDMPKIAPLRRQGKPLIPHGEVDPFNLREPIRTKPLVAAFKGRIVYARH